MALVEEVVDLSDNDDDDCVLESVVYGCNHKHYNYDDVYKENPLLAEIIEKCLNLENTEGMHRVINKTLLGLYKEAEATFIASSEFEATLKKTLIKLDKEPHHKFTHIKHLCEVLQFKKFRKRAQLTTLEKNITGNKTFNLSLKRKHSKENRSKIPKIDIIDLDKFEEIPIINLDYDHNDDSITVIDDEKENHSENGECFVQKDGDSLIVHVENSNGNRSSKENGKNFVKSIEDKLLPINHVKQKNNVTNDRCFMENREENLLLPSNNAKENHYVKESDGRLLESNEDNLLVPINDVMLKETGGCFMESSQDNLLVPINDVEENHTAKDNYGCFVEGRQNTLLVPQNILVVNEATNAEKVKNIELEIASYKAMIAKLDEEEVTDDSLNSPYLKSEKLKAKIVLLYKELCELTGTESTKRREIRLKVIDGHPSGPVKRLERFLNKNIGSDGNPPFPDFTDVVNCVIKANIKDNLGWQDAQIKHEARALFVHCGRALQKRRQKREWSDLLAWVKGEQFDGDPADHDPELQARLMANKRAAVMKESEILQRYSMMQNLPSSSATVDNGQYTSTHNAEQYTSTHNAGQSTSTQNAEQYTSTHNAEQYTSTHNAGQSTSTQNAEQYTSTHNAGQSTSTHNTGQSTSTQNAEQYTSTHNAGQYTSTPNAGQYTSTQNTGEYTSTHNAGVDTCNKSFSSQDSSMDENNSENVFVNTNKITSHMQENQLNRIETIDVNSNSQQNKEFQSDKSNDHCESGTAKKKCKDFAKCMQIVNTFSTCESRPNSSKEISNVEKANFNTDVANKYAELLQTVNPLMSYNTTDPTMNNNNSKEMSNVEKVYLNDTNSNIVFEVEHTGLLQNIHVIPHNIKDSATNKSSTQDSIKSNGSEISCSEEVNTTEVKDEIEFGEVKVKIEPTETVVKLLDDLGDDYTVSVFDIEDPFLVVEISDSSDED